MVKTIGTQIMIIFKANQLIIYLKGWKNDGSKNRNTLHPSYSERVEAVKTVHNNRVFTRKSIRFFYKITIGAEKPVLCSPVFTITSFTINGMKYIFKKIAKIRIVFKINSIEIWFHKKFVKLDTQLTKQLKSNNQDLIVKKWISE